MIALAFGVQQGNLSPQENACFPLRTPVSGIEVEVLFSMIMENLTESHSLSCKPRLPTLTQRLTLRLTLFD